jgi:uncharacterized membrane protein YgcG
MVFLSRRVQLMSNYRFARGIVCAVTSFATLTGNPLVTAADKPKPVSEAPVRVKDVQLSEGGTMNLTVVDTKNTPHKDVQVSVVHQKRVVAAGKTDAHGQVRFTNLRPGQHSIQTGADTQIVRLWNSDTAPQGAVKKMVVSAEGDVVRGQGGGGFAGGGFGGGGFGGGGALLGIAGLAGGVYGGIAATDAQDDVDTLRQQIATSQMASP